jgi:hypothetical protein
MEISRPDIAAIAEIVSREVQNNLAALSVGRWLTLPEAMMYARVKSPNTIRKWIDKGYIYASKRTGQWVVDRESIDDWFLREKDS